MFFGYSERGRVTASGATDPGAGRTRRLRGSACSGSRWRCGAPQGRCQICVVQSQNTSAAIVRKPMEAAAPVKSRRAWPT